MFVKDVKDIYCDSKNLKYHLWTFWIATKNIMDTNPHLLTLDYW